MVLAHQQMVERAVDAFEEQAHVAPVVKTANVRRPAAGCTASSTRAVVTFTRLGARANW